MRFDRDDALIVVDVQRDFCPGGAIPIAGGDRIVPVINRLIEETVAAGGTVIASRDWHPKGHISFQSCGGSWPEHCVQNSDGAKFHNDLHLPANILVISKGADLDRDQFSAFDDTGLADELRRRGICRAIVCGLALDICVRATALDALHEGFRTLVEREATRPVTEAAGDAVISEMTRAGVVIKSEKPLAQKLNGTGS